MTTEPLIRAYTVQSQLEFTEQYFEDATKERVGKQIPPEIREELAQRKAVDWIPVAYASTVLRAVASGKNDADGSFADVVECGKFVAELASNTFYKLLLKVVTPPLFFRKLDKTFWGRDFKNIGAWDVQIDESAKTAELQLSKVGGLEHIGPLNEGFMRYIFGAMGKEIRVETKGWGLEEPGPETITYDVAWS